MPASMKPTSCTMLAPWSKAVIRLKLISALKPVDLALLGDLEDPMKTVEHVKPDVIALGYDQKHNERQIEAELRARGLKARVIRLDVHVPGVKSSKILARLLREL